MFVETSPGPDKYAASLLGHCLPDLRLPMAPVSDRTRDVVAGALKAAGLL
jgi:4-hydroxy-tetrahydrodipicolinate synthase